MPRRVVSTSGSSGITPISGPWGQKVRPPIKKPGLCRAFSVSEHAGSLDLRFLVRHVLARNGVVLLHFHLVWMEALVLGGHVEVAGVGGREQLYFFAHGFVSWRYSFTPLARNSASTLSMPFFSMVRRPAAEMRSDTQRFSVSTQKRWVCRLGRKRRRRLLFA